MYRYFLSLIASILLSQLALGQIVVQQVDPYSGNLNTVLEDYFFGEGITVTNAQFKGVDVQFGVFLNAQNDLGLDEGIVLSTGRVEDVVGLNDTASSILRGLPNRVDDDADLKKLADFMVDTLDRIYTNLSLERVENMSEAAILEFDVTTRGNTLDFDFVFGSEEYSAWINTRFVDVMGIFVSGPNINGPYSNGAINIAELPGGRLPLSVSSVHGGNSKYQPFNEQYYVPTITQNIAFGGVTVPLKNSITVAPCTVYHVKIAIADGSLPDKDSGIFLKKQGLNSDGITATLLPQNAVSFPDSLYQEGCALVAVKLDLPKVQFSTTYLQQFAFGTVADNADINFETSIVQRVSDRVDTVYYAVNYDFFNEGKEYALFELKNTSGCVVSNNSIAFYIDDRQSLTLPNPNNDTLYYSCQSAGVTLKPTTNYSADLAYAWTDNVPVAQQYDSSVTIFPQNDDETFTVTITDTCSNEQVMKNFVVIKTESTPLFVDIPKDTLTFSCQGASFTPAVNITGGTSPFQYTVIYDNQNYTDTILKAVNATASEYYGISVRDACGQLVSDSVFIQVPQYNALSFGVSAPSTICPNDRWQVITIVNGGAGNYMFSYNGIAYNGDTLNLLPKESGSYLFEVMDACGNIASQELTLTIDELSANFELNYLNDNTVKCINLSQKAENFEWFTAGEIFSTEVEPIVVLDINETATITLVASNKDGCTDTLSKSIEPAPRYYIPTAFTPDGDGMNDCFQPVGLAPDEYTLDIFDRWGQIVYTTSDWGQCWDGLHPGSKKAVTGMYTLRMYVRYKNLKSTYNGKVLIVQ